MIELRSILKEVHPKLHISDKGIEKAKDHLSYLVWKMKED